MFFFCLSHNLVYYILVPTWTKATVGHKLNIQSIKMQINIYYCVSMFFFCLRHNLVYYIFVPTWTKAMVGHKLK